MPKSITRFVVLFHGRSGASYLKSMLNSHPKIHAFGETLVGHENVEQQMVKARERLTVDPDTKLHAVGFKTKFSDLLNFEAFSMLLHELDCRVIYLRRRNWVKWAVSWQNAIRLNASLGKWNLKSQDKNLGPIAIDPDLFHEWLENVPELLQVSDEMIGTMRLPVLRLHYEQLLVEPQETIDNVFSFLDVPPMKFHSELKKNTNDDLRKVIKNFDELRERYVGTEYESMFDEVLVP
jgi:hypothetical protein